VADSVLLVDYENIGKLDLGAIPAGVRVPFFFGAIAEVRPHRVSQGCTEARRAIRADRYRGAGEECPGRPHRLLPGRNTWHAHRKLPA